MPGGLPRGLVYLLVALLAAPAAPALAAHSSAVPGAPAGRVAPVHPQPFTHFPSTGGPRVPTHRPLTLGVNPNSYYSIEPAPMGIADFGINPSNSAAYTYNTTEFLGTVTINSLSVWNGATLGAADQLTIQLNVVEVFTGSSGSYAYWIQDVAWLNSTSNLVYFIDNVWNMSSSGAALDSNSITGNGSAVYGFYYDVASYQTGNQITLSYPSTVELRVIASTVSKQPAVAFEYDDAGSWQTYDNVVFPFASGYASQGFVVDGTQYNNFGLFNDAELIFGGPGGGSQTSDVKSNVSVSLSYWNGHNLQAIPNAYNFGSDTAEGINNTVVQPHYSASNGSLEGVLKGGSTLGLSSLYDHSYDSFVNITSPLASGRVLLNGTVVANFVGGEANLTITPGTYDIELETTTGSRFAEATFAIPVGSYVPITFAGAGWYTVTFKESGLPTGTPWQATVNGSLFSSSGPAFSLLARNATLRYNVTAIAGWTTSPWSSNFTVNGSDVIVGVPWTRVTYAVNFSESGLPSNLSWQVVVGGSAYRSSSALIHVLEPNGSYPWFISGIAGYAAIPSSGTLSIQAFPQSIQVTWGVARYAATFTETGLPQNSAWSLVIGGTSYFAASASARVTLPNGTYTYHVNPVAGYETTPWGGSFSVAGAALIFPVVFTQFRFTVTLSEVGLPSGTNWTVTVGTLKASGTATSEVLQLANGSYLANFTTHAPYQVSGGNVTFTVRGSVASVGATFVPLPGWIYGIVTPGNATVTVDGTPVTVRFNTFNITAATGNHTVTVSAPGFQTVSRSVAVGPRATAKVTVELSPNPPGTGNGGGVVHAGGSGAFPLLDLALIAIAAIVVVAALVAVAVRRRRASPPPEEPPVESDEPPAP